jgi:Tfp pilus assembly protein FimT
MVVVVIIAILATIAVPSVALRMRERRSQQTALEIAGLYREARMRALGRGASIMVSYKDAKWQVREGVEGAAASTLRTGDDKCANLPTRGCTSNDWGAATSRQVGALDPAGVAEDIGASVEFQGAATDEIDVCFSPLGRTFVRIGEGAWSPLTSVLTVDVQREDEDSEKVGLKRKVVVLPNGTARLAL